jgi:hypothetical protein
MTTINAGLGRLLAGAGGALLIASLFLPWIAFDGDTNRNGWEISTTLDLFCLITGLLGIAAAVTGGRFGFFRPDLSLNGTADIFGVVATILIGWLLLFDFPTDASREPGAYLALIAAITIACGAGDFRVRSLFPELPGGERPAP